MFKKNERWLSYDSVYDGKQSVVQVDMKPVNSAAERNALPVLLLLRAAPKKNFEADISSPLNSFKLTRILQSLNRVSAKSSACIVAARTWGSALLVYAYGPDEPSVLALVKECEKNRGMITEYETSFDPEWRVYRKEVYPSAAARQTVQNGEQIDKMVQYGDDIHAPRRINHYCSFTDEISRIGFQESARKAGFALGDPFYLPEKDMPHGMCVRHIGSIDKHTLDTWTTKLIDIVELYNGRYDCWDCQLMRKNRTKGVPAKKK